MDDKTVKSLIYKSAYPSLKKIVSNNIKTFEQIKNETQIGNEPQIGNETQIIIDLNIVYSEIKNSMESIVNYLVDRFKILDKDTLIKNLVVHIYNIDVKECILKINKIIPNETLNELNSEEKNKYLIKYLVDELIKCIFTIDIINMILELSKNKSNNFIDFINILLTNWKTLSMLFSLMLILLLIRKSYVYLKNL